MYYKAFCHMFKELMVHAINFIVKFYPMSGLRKLQYCSSVFYNYWIRQQLGHVGEKTYFGKGLRIQGGGGIRLL